MGRHRFCRYRLLTLSPPRGRGEHSSCGERSQHSGPEEWLIECIIRAFPILNRSWSSFEGFSGITNRTCLKCELLQVSVGSFYVQMSSLEKRKSEANSCPSATDFAISGEYGSARGLVRSRRNRYLSSNAQ